MQALLHELLHEAGYITSGCRAAQDAQYLIATEHPDLLIVDLHLLDDRGRRPTSLYDDIIGGPTCPTIAPDTPHAPHCRWTPRAPCSERTSRRSYRLCCSHCASTSGCGGCGYRTAPPCVILRTPDAVWLRGSFYDRTYQLVYAIIDAARIPSWHKVYLL
jgi:hypothetical protein